MALGWLLGCACIFSLGHSHAHWFGLKSLHRRENNGITGSHTSQGKGQRDALDPDSSRGIVSGTVHSAAIHSGQANGRRYSPVSFGVPSKAVSSHAFDQALSKKTNEFLSPRKREPMNYRKPFPNILNVPAVLSICSVLLYFTIFPFPAWATDYFVKTPANGGSNANSGLDWANAKATIGAGHGNGQRGRQHKGRGRNLQ